VRASALFLAAMLTGCAATLSGAETVVRTQALLLQPGAEATLRIDCPPGLMPVTAMPEAGGAFTVTESRPAEPGSWWVTFANPSDTQAREEITVRLMCR
jgi:hypothetical protein